MKFKVTLWGDLASSVSESFKPDLEKPVIGILTSAKLSTFRGMYFLFIMVLITDCADIISILSLLLSHLLFVFIINIV